MLRGYPGADTPLGWGHRENWGVRSGGRLDTRATSLCWRCFMNADAPWGTWRRTTEKGLHARVGKKSRSHQRWWAVRSRNTTDNRNVRDQGEGFVNGRGRGGPQCPTQTISSFWTGRGQRQRDPSYSSRKLRRRQRWGTRGQAVSPLGEFTRKGTLGFVTLVSEQLKCVLTDRRRRQGIGREDGITRGREEWS